jgi:hypothetical protein
MVRGISINYIESTQSTYIAECYDVNLSLLGYVDLPKNWQGKSFTLNDFINQSEDYQSDNLEFVLHCFKAEGFEASDDIGWNEPDCEITDYDILKGDKKELWHDKKDDDYFAKVIRKNQQNKK